MKNFIGYKKIIDGFFRRVDNGTLSHAHLIYGPDGIGKSLLARIFSLKILGKTVDVDYVDIINYRAKKSSIGVDEVRDIIEEISKKPYEGDKKVVIIHEGNKLTTQAQNALLKTIEEPPIGVYIIILTESLEVLLDTIKSRCQIYKLTPLSNEDMIKYIQRLGEFSEEKFRAALAYSEGIPGRAERLLKDDSLAELRDILIKLLLSLGSSGVDELISFESKLLDYKADKEEVLNLLSLFIRDIIVYKELEDKEMIINIDKYTYIEEIAKSLSYKKLNSILKYIEEGRVNLISNGSYSLVISSMIMDLLEV